MKKPQYRSGYTNFTQAYEPMSPTKRLEESPGRKPQRPSLAIADQLRREHGHHTIQNQDFSKRLEQIKRKYTSPVRHPRIVSTPVSPVDFNLHTKRSIIQNENKLRGKEDIAPVKGIGKHGLDAPRTSHSTFRQPLQTLNSSLQVPRFCSSNNDTKRVQDDLRINSIDTINEKIKNILDGINYQNDRFCEKPRMTETIEHSGLRAMLSARPEEGKERERRHLFTHGSIEKDSRLVDSSDKLFLNATLNKNEKKYMSKDFENKMMDIQQRIKRSEENRMRAIASLESKQPPAIVPSTRTSPQKPTAEVSKFEQPRDRSNTGAYSHRYIDFGKNKSRNILQELRSFGRQETKEDKRVSEDIVAPVKNQTRRLINVFVEQVKLDQELRNAKIWLEINNDSDKWVKLKEAISKKEGRVFSDQEIKNLLKCTQEDHNPFFVNQPSESLDGIINKYMNAEQHWKGKVLKQFNLSLLRQQGFKSQVLDLELKGYLQIEDIVRYLNIETGRFYRNRDLSLIFKRVSKANKMSFQEFIRAICG